MSWPWFKNFFGLTVTDEEMRKIPRPYPELMLHATFKSIQAFGLLGTFVAGVLSAVLVSSTRNFSDIKTNAVSYGKWGVVCGLFAGPLITHARLVFVNADAAAVYDRCYRLRCNRNQVRLDRASIFGAVGGSMLATLAGGSPVLGALLGMFGGMVSAAFYNSSSSKQV
jgi:hypothetical protein